jgi:hypothetical protein
MSEDNIIKSALEIAMEKAEKIQKATPDEMVRWQYAPEGEKLASRYLREELNLTAELNKFDEKARKHVAAGVSEVLIRNIGLPKDNIVKKNNTRAMDGLKLVKSDKTAVENVFSQMRHIFNHFVTQGAQQRKQAYESLKVEFEAKMRQAIQQQYGSAMGARVDAERQPQFQEEWRKAQTQLDSQYINLLDEMKKELANIK